MAARDRRDLNRRLRDDLLSSGIFATVDEARLHVDRWRLRYNHRRIQWALGTLAQATLLRHYL